MFDFNFNGKQDSFDSYVAYKTSGFSKEEDFEDDNLEDDTEDSEEDD